MDWDPEGFLPLSLVTSEGVRQQSPYRLSLMEFAERFGDSPYRSALVLALLNYRALLRSVGVESWFQWVDGSFLENALVTRGREPADMDLVTFYYLPEGRGADEFQAHHPEPFDWERVKRDFGLDSYCVPLNGDSPGDLLIAFMYWRDWWSHTREGRAKGFVELGCPASEDEECLRFLSDGPAVEYGE